MELIRIINNQNECFYLSKEKEYEFTRDNEYKVDSILDDECVLIYHEENDSYGLSKFEVGEAEKTKIESLAL